MTKVTDEVTRSRSLKRSRTTLTNNRKLTVSLSALAVGVLAPLMIAAIGMGAWWYSTVNPSIGSWDPIDDLPDQEVLSVDLEAGLNGIVKVAATKCYKEDVDVFGHFTWQSVEPPGTVLPGRSGTAIHSAGCETTVSDNPVPPEALSIDAKRGPLTWVITGFETPVDEERGLEGVTHTWRTNPFQLATTPTD